MAKILQDLFRDQLAIYTDEAVFADFRRQCLSTDNWVNKYDSNGMQVWVEVPAKKENRGPKIHKIKCKIVIRDVSAATMYDVLHDNQYRRDWDPNMEDSYDIARLSANADVGYYSWRCLKPLKKRDVLTLRSWKVTDDEYVIVNFSVKHPKYPPTSKFVRAVSILTGYFIKATGPTSCIFTYLSQADPKGLIPKVVVNTATQMLAPKVMKCVHKAGQDYSAWKENNSPQHKPWLHPDQNTLPMMDPAELSIQRADSLEDVDTCTKGEGQDGEDSP